MNKSLKQPNLNPIQEGIKKAFPEKINETKDIYSGVVEGIVQQIKKEKNNNEDSWVLDMVYSDALGEGLDWSKPKDWKNYQEVFDSDEFKTIIYEIVLSDKKYLKNIGNLKLLFSKKEITDLIKKLRQEEDLEKSLEPVENTPAKLSLLMSYGIFKSKIDQFSEIKVINVLQAYLFVRENIQKICEKLSDEAIKKLITPIKHRHLIYQYSENSDISPFIREYLSDYIINQILNFHDIKDKYGSTIDWGYIYSNSELNWSKKASEDPRLQKVIKDNYILENPDLNPNEGENKRESEIFW